MGVELEAHVRYVGRLRDLSYGRIPRAELITVLSSGRLASVLLEHEIAAVFGIAPGTQGASADLIDPRLGQIQVKTFRSAGDAVFASGPRVGRRKSGEATIWTTKSGFWDRRNRLTASQVQEAGAYLRSYDHFMYVDIAHLGDLRYSFVVIPSADVVASSDGFCISEDAILAGVRTTVTLPD